MNKIKSTIKFQGAPSSNQPEFQRVMVLNGIKVSIHDPIASQQSQIQQLPANAMKVDEIIPQMVPRILGQSCCMPILTKIGSQDIRISDCGSAQQPFHQLKQSQTTSQTTKVSGHTFYTFANNANLTFDGSMETSFCSLENIGNKSSIHEYKNSMEKKIEKATDNFIKGKNVLLKQNISEVSCQAKTQCSLKQKENRLKQERKVFDFKPIASRLKLSPQYQNINAIKKGKEKTQEHQVDLQRRKIIEESKKDSANSRQFSSNVHKQSLTSPLLRGKRKQRLTKVKSSKSDEPKTTKMVQKLTIGEKYGVTNKKMFDVIQEEIDQDMKEASISLEYIPYFQELMKITQMVSSQPSDQDLIKFLNMRNLIRDYIMLLNDPSQLSEKKLLY